MIKKVAVVGFLLGFLLSYTSQPVGESNLVLNQLPQPRHAERVEYKPVSRGNAIAVQPLGDFIITYYCLQGTTANGSKVTDGVTCAVDPAVIPMGSYLCIEGIGLRVAQDTGDAVKGKHIDVYVPDYNQAIAQGIDHAAVYLVDNIR